MANHSGLITCYDYQGQPFTDNFQCPGSLRCCAQVSDCTPEGLCTNSQQQLVRPACSVYPWTTGCSPLCLYENSNGVLPRLNTCADGSKCCDNAPQCCQEHAGVILNQSGQIISTESAAAAATSTISSAGPSANPAGSTGKAISSATAVASPSSSITSPAQPAATSQALSGGAIAGVVLGSLIALSLIAIAALLAQRRRAQSRIPSGEGKSGSFGIDTQPLPDEVPPEYQPAREIAELGPNEDYYR